MQKAQRFHHERGDGAQRGEPQHSSDEQQGDVAVLHPGHRPPPHHPAQHPVRQRTGGLDPHQPHPQSGQWSGLSDTLFKKFINDFRGICSNI